MKSHRGRITNKKAFRVAARRYLQVRAEELKNLEEKRAALVEEMEGILNKAQEEERAFEESEQVRFDEIEKEINAIDKTIEAKERARNLGNPGGKKKEDGENDNLTVEERAFVDYVRGTLTNERAANLTYADNGAVIPSSIVNKIIEKVVEICPIYSMADRYNIGGTINIPYYDEETSSIKMAYADEFTELTSTSGNFGILKQDIGISTSETYQDSAKGFVANQIWDVKKGDIIYTTATYCGLCIYDASGTLQEHFNDGNKNHTVTVDSARFLRYYCSSSSSTYTTDFMLSIDEPLPSTYEAYKPDKKISNFINLEEKINENGQNVKDLSKSVNGIELSKNLLDNSSVIANKRPSNWAGQTINDSYKTDGYHTFKAIPVTQNNTYYFVENGDLVNFGQLLTYDKDGKYVSLLSPSVFNVNGVNVGYIIPENIAYVRGESKTSDFSKVNFKLFNGRFEKKFLKYNESAYGKKILPVVVFDFDQVVEIDARFTILKKYGFVGNVVEVATNNYEITKELIRMGYDISPYLGNHTWDYSTDEGIQNLTANIAEKLGGLETVGVYNPTMISCSGHKYSDTMEKILSSYKIDYVRCSGFIKNGVSLKKSMYENSYDTRIVVPISLGSYNGADEFNATIDSLVDGNVPLIMPFMHTFGYDADWITQEAFEKVVSHVSDLVKNGKALCMNMHDFVAYNDTVKSIHDDYIRNMSAIFN